MIYLTPPARASLAALSLALLQACGASSGPGASSPERTARDTTVKHETCDIGSSSAKKSDADGDGKPNLIQVMSGGKEVCRAVDLNLDGAIDAFIYYDDAGRVRRREADFDRDGHADEIATYVNGALTLKERETNYDGKLDTWDHYEGGRLVRRERDSDGDGYVDQWWDFDRPDDPDCAKVSGDTNADGTPDPSTTVDLCADKYPTEEEPAPSTAPASSAPPSAEPAPSATPTSSAGPTSSADPTSSPTPGEEP